MDCSMIRLDGVTKRFGDAPAVETRRCASTAASSWPSSGPPAAGRRRSYGSSPASSAGPRVCRSRRRRVAGGAWVPPEARQVGMVFQDYALFPHLTVAATWASAFPAGTRGRVPELARHRRARRAREALSARALGRPAAARCARTRARAGPELVLARRAVVERRPVPARVAPRGGDRHHPAARRHGAARHARPRGGVLVRRPDRADARRRIVQEGPRSSSTSRPHRAGPPSSSVPRTCSPVGSSPGGSRRARRVPGERRQHRDGRAGPGPARAPRARAPRRQARRRSWRASSAATTSSTESSSTAWSSSRSVRRRRSSTSDPACRSVFTRAGCRSSTEACACPGSCKVYLTSRLRLLLHGGRDS